MSEFLLEVGVQELPSGYLDPALDFIKSALANSLEEARLSCDSVVVDGTPRRLAVMIRSLGDKQPDAKNEVTGPKAEVAFLPDGSLSQAGLGFVKGRGARAEDAFRKSTPKGDLIALVVEEKGKTAQELLPAIIQHILSSIPFPKTMRWDDSGVKFARPIQWLLCLINGEVLPCSFGQRTSASLTYGHRYLSPEAVTVRSIDDYLAQLSKRYVMLSRNERRQCIQEESKKLTAQTGGAVQPDPALLETVKNLVEYPWPILGSFGDAFSDIPKEILVSEMREHQRYFAVTDSGGKLLPSFIIVAGSKPVDDALLARGNARVLRARFDDGAFYYRQDLQVPLEKRVEQLKGLVFQRELGTVHDKVERISALVMNIGARLELSDAEIQSIKRAAYLCKADLVTGVIGEFPDLQGIMGAIYARHSGESEAVAAAIEEHYKPRSAEDSCPGSKAGAVLALADRLDTLVGLIGIGKLPKGSADPFGLRRAAVGIVRIILDQELHLSLRDLGLTPTVADFIVARARGVLLERVELLGSKQAVAVVDAVLAVQSDDILDAWERCEALERLRAQDEQAFMQMAQVFRRAGNIVKKAQEDGLFSAGESFDEGLLQLPSERALLAQLDKTKHLVGYMAMLQAVAGAKPDLDKFFDEAMVMVDEVPLRNARLGLLARVTAQVSGVADFTRIVV